MRELTDKQIEARAREIAKAKQEANLKAFEEEYKALCEKYNLILDFQTRVIVRPLKTE